MLDISKIGDKNLALRKELCDIGGITDQTRVRQMNALKFGEKKPVSLIVRGDGLMLSL